MFVLLTLLLSASALALPNAKPVYNLNNAEHYFEQFIQKYDRVYENKEEKQMRFAIFKESLREINRRNMMEGEHATFGINHFADLTKEEMESHMGLLPTSAECKLLIGDGYQRYHDAPPAVCDDLVIGNAWDGSSDDLPEQFDWRDKNVVSDVKNQDKCGSCWTFSTTGNIESQYAMKYGKIRTFSEQQLIDCNLVNRGCHGGLLNISFGDLLANGGIMTEDDYPYKAVRGVCKFDANKAKAKLSKCYSLDLQNEDKLRAYLLKTGPLSIAINGGVIMSYNGGVIKDCDPTVINHGVLLVGWGTEDGLPYWTIKNSWSTNWGEKGYFRILRGKNTCGLMNHCAGTAVLV